MLVGDVSAVSKGYKPCQLLILFSGPAPISFGMAQMGRSENWFYPLVQPPSPPLWEGE